MSHFRNLRSPRTSSRVASSLATSLVAAALLLPTSVDAQCSTDERWQRAELNLGSGVPAPIVENVGHLGIDVAYASVGATGTAARFLDGGGSASIILLDDGVFRVAFEPIGTDGPPNYTTLDLLAGDVTLLGPGAPGTLDAWGTLRVDGQWGAAVAEHRTTSRTLRSEWSGPAADLDRIAFQVDLLADGTATATSDSASGELRIVPTADPSRALTLYPAKARIGDEVTHLPFVASAEGVVTLGAPVPEGATLETLLVFAPYSHHTDAVADGLGGWIGVGTTVDAIESAGVGTGRDVAIVRVDSTGRGFAGMTVLASSGTDDFAGITASSGDTFVAGSAGAADFPIAAPRKGASYPSPFLARLAVDGSLAAGTHLRQHGFETARDVALDADGRLLVAGDATGSATTTEPIDLTAVLPTGSSSADYVLAEIAPTLATATRVQVFQGDASPLPVEVRPGCDGKIVVGLPTATFTAASSCPDRWNRDSYPMSFLSPASFYYLDTFANGVTASPPYDQWGYHALRWKEQFGTAYLWNPAVLYDPVAASTASPAVPVGHVTFNDHTRLDALEANLSVFPNGDPAGTWLRNDAQDYLELMLGASAYLEFWGSPTYANLRYDTQLSGGGYLTGAVAITEVDWCSNPAAGGSVGAGPIAHCQQTACQNPPCKFPIDQWDDVCPTDVNYTVQSGQTLPNIHLARLQYTHWDQVYTEDKVENYRQDVKTRFDQASSLREIYVADPPNGVEFAESFVAEGVQRELARVVEDVPVTITSISGGTAGASQAGTGLVRAADRIAAGL